MNVIGLLERKARELADKPAFIFREKQITFSQLRDNVFTLASGLKSLGLKKGDKTAIYLPNCPEYIYSYLAVWCLGLTAVPLDFMLTEDELVSCLSHSEAKILIAKSKISVNFEDIKANSIRLKDIIITDENPPLSSYEAGFLNLKTLLEQVEVEVFNLEINDKDCAIIFYTSGTTGNPKGVLINYRQLGAPVKSMEYFVDLNANDTTVCALPFSHLGGLIYIQNSIFFGITVVLMERFTPLEFLKNVQNYKATCFWIVPSMYYAFLQLKEFESLDLSRLRWIVTFGASSSPEALRRFHSYCPKAHLLNGWGLTETNAPTTVLPLGADKIESVGRPAPWIEVRVFDENDMELPQGEVGEVVVKSWVVTEGYFKDAEATKKVLRNGWFHTGDLGRFDAEGHLYIAGRIKEMIKVAGEIVFEPEVEAAIQRHMAVLETAVIAVMDKIRGEVPKAFVVLKEGESVSEEDLRYFLRRHLAHFKIPHYFEFVKSLEKNRTGKIDKEALRKK